MAQTVQVRWDEFEAAFIIGHPDAQYYFNTMTGEVIYRSHMDDEATRERIETKVSSAGWVPVPRASTPQGMAEIQTFVDRETDEGFRAEWSAALSESIPFRAFMMALVGKPEAKERWNGIREAGIAARMHGFCAEHNVEIDDPRFSSSNSA